MRYEKPPCLPITDADISGFFPSGLEYNPPARGVWNIVHMGMLIPQAHQIYLCAQGCLRGVALTAAEMNALDRLSWVSVSETDIIDGSLESDIFDGVSEILTHMTTLPPAVLVFVSCMHLFSGADIPHMLDKLRTAFPQTDFIDCYMTPTMRKALPPIIWLNMQMYSLLRPMPVNKQAVSIIGCDRATDTNSELLRILQHNHLRLHDINLCSSYHDFQQIAESGLFLSYIPAAQRAAADAAKRLGRTHLHIPASFDYNEITGHYRKLCEALGIPVPDFSEDISAAEAALAAAYAVIGDTNIALDFTAVTQPFSLAKLLCTHGFSVCAIFADAAGEDAAAFCWLQENRPEITLYAAANVNLLHMAEQPHPEMLAIGQKAAYYFATDHFVNIVSNGGYYGFAGICAIAEQMTDAALHPKDRRTLLAHKGFGCESCLMG